MMKKKAWLGILGLLFLLAILFVPIPMGQLRDGGTRIYSAMTYKVMNWNRITNEQTYQATAVYWFPDNLKSVDELWKSEAQKVVHSFIATVLQISGDSVLVQPVAGEDESHSSDKISFYAGHLGDIGAKVGSDVLIYYTGSIMETYPAQIKAIKWEIATNLRHREYTAQWLDKQIAKKYDSNLFGDIVITEIYANCFFATPVVPMPYRIKLNGQLSQDWCVGDQVICTYENVYYDEQNGRIEADLLTVEPSNFRLDPNACYKPVIYLYPQQEMEVTVKLLLSGKLTCTYPAYGTGWKITAAPDGTLTDARGQKYNYLYWEGQTDAQWNMAEGFCVKGSDTAAFLEVALEKQGLNRREANEFIVYWLPLMQDNPYNLISFQTDVYTDAARLQIDPAPDTLIRVFMVWRALDAFIQIPEQQLSAPERSGFTVVEWGGTELLK